jgi:hypothetical protein
MQSERSDSEQGQGCGSDAAAESLSLAQQIDETASNCEDLIAEMDHESLRRLPTTMRCNSVSETWHNLITEECRIICAAFWNVDQIVDAFDGPRDRN